MRGFWPIGNLTRRLVSLKWPTICSETVASAVTNNTGFCHCCVSRLAGYEDVNDSERLSVDPAMRHVVGVRAALTDKHAASASEVGRFETEIIHTSSNLKKLMDLSDE